MTPTKSLRLRLHLIEGALALLLGLLTTAAVSTHQLLLDAANRPTNDVSLASPHWVDTLDAARLPASVPLLDDSGTLIAPGTFRAAGGAFSVDGDGNVSTNALLFDGQPSVDSGGFYYPDGSFLADVNKNVYGAFHGDGADLTNLHLADAADLSLASGNYSLSSGRATKTYRLAAIHNAGSADTIVATLPTSPQVGDLMRVRVEMPATAGVTVQITGADIPLFTQSSIAGAAFAALATFSYHSGGWMLDAAQYTP